MNQPENSSRRALLMKVGILFNGVVAALLAVPVVRYLLSPVARSRRAAYETWLQLGSLEQFPVGETRFASFRNPDIQPTDGKTADTSCWVRRIDDQAFQVFAINCAHLGCPVRWFPQSRLFLCPCHGGAYYEDGSRASGPPERGLFEYAYKLEAGRLFVKAGELPTPGAPSGPTSALVNISGKLPCG
jgi:menaquinol-cytochrome c reductase iron-sulfur subunit